MIQERILELVKYGLTTGLVDPADEVYTVNRLLEVLGVDDIEDETFEKVEAQPAWTQEEAEEKLEGILEDMMTYAYDNGIMKENSIVYKDLFDTKLMGCLVNAPSVIRARFKDLYDNESSLAATDYFYKLSCDSNYIRRQRIKKDMKWTTDTEYGTLDVTINLSKPEKDPKAIAAAKNAKQSAYPKCQLCKENEGYAGRVNHPARENHRIIPVTINNSQWFFQYSPYVYYNEHCIVFNSKHTPMKIERATFGKLLDFVTQFPHYFVGSNADLPIVGGSILSHDHFQGGHYTFAMAKAPIEKEITFKGYEDVEAGIVKWPMSVIRIKSADRDKLIDLADKILLAWRGYTDEEAFIFAETDGEPHNTITPIARRRDGDYELDLVLRNNITTEEHPLGVYHPHAHLHHIKKENIGLIEVMGLAVLPARLKGEMAELKDAIITEYGTLDVTINLSKPEKDPKAIAAAKNAKQSAYPKCQLCKENEGYAGRVNHPARENHRIIPVTINNSQWFFQYSPYVYYNEHCIVFNSKHTPMKIERATFGKLLDFVTQFPHYFVGSNADLPIVGGSILSHDHFQGGHYTFAMAKAPIEKEITFKGYEDVEAGIVKWPMSVIRIKSADRDKLIDLADKILLAWRGYTDEEAFIFAETDGEPHNTITPIARRRDGDYELDLVLRNNITTEEHPLGVYHPHAHLHHIKKENIGLIEVMGLAVLPARLKGEMAELKDAIITGKDLHSTETLASHADWALKFMSKYDKIDESNIDGIINEEIGLVFKEVLECAGVYKCTDEGRAAFQKFIDAVNL